MSAELERLRGEIDRGNDEILELLSKRARGVTHATLVELALAGART